MGKIISFTDSIHIKETHKEITISIDKPSEVYHWLKELQEYYSDDLFDILYALIENAATEIAENY